MQAKNIAVFKKSLLQRCPFAYLQQRSQLNLHRDSGFLSSYLLTHRQSADD